jgi:hypothetical protein
LTLPDITTPAELAARMGWSERHVRDFARRLGACRVLGNRMVLLPEDVHTIMEAAKPCPSKSTNVRQALSGTIGERLPDIDSAALLAQLTKKSRRELRPRLKTKPTNVVLMDRKTR